MRVRALGLLKQHLEKTGKKQADLARALNVSRASVHDWLAGVKRPREPMRRLIELWTDGDVPEGAWVSRAERKREATLRKGLSSIKAEQGDSEKKAKAA
jgi:transcriptional regulator with XRE-family HTH domain